VPNAVNVQKLSQEYPVAELDLLKIKLGKKPEDIFIITTSRLVHKNAVDDVIKSLALLPTHIQFLILGTGPDEAALRKLAQEAGVAGRVQWLGQVEHTELPKYLKISDIFIRPSRSEGMGNSFIEAMAAGLPVIATQQGGIADFLFDAKRNPDKSTTGWAVDVESPQQIAEAVTEIISNPEGAKRVIEMAKAMVVEKYDWDLIAKDMREKVFGRVFKNS
jgi:glycosyltransferase involved in cell wall biosynthesis